MLARGLALVAVGALALVACAGKPPPPDAFHRLAVPAAAARATPLLDGGVEVDRLGAVAALRSRPLAVVDASTGTLRHARYDFWVEAPPALLQHALVDYLRGAGVATKVVVPELRADARWVVGGRVERFEWVRDGGVALALELVLRDRATGELRAHGVYEIERAGVAGDAASAVTGLASAAGEAFAAFVADVERALAAGARP